MPSIREQVIFSIGEGGIDPQARIDTGEISAELIDEFVNRLQGDEFFIDIPTGLIPNGCVDGRGNQVVGPNAAGGSFSLVMGDALADQAFREAGEAAPSHARRLFAKLAELGQHIGGHTDSLAHGPNCGCGAEDKLDSHETDKPSILRYISRRGHEIRDFLDTLGVQTSNETHQKILNRAQELQADRYATTGAELRDVTQEIGGKEATPALPGEHVEAVLVIDTRDGKALDRAKVHEAFGGSVDAFYLNVPALKFGTSLLAVSQEEADDRFAGALYYNVATAATLAKNLRIVVL